MDISSHGDAKETEEAKRIIEMEKAMEQEGVKCFVVMANRTDLAKFRGARVQAIREDTLEQWMVAPVELVRSVLTEDWSDDYAASEHWSKYWNAVSALSDNEWPEGLTEDGDKLWPYTPFTRSPDIYFIVVYLFRSTDDVSLSLIPLVHVVDQEETGYGVGHRL